MARAIPISWMVEPEIAVDVVDNLVKSLLMTCGSPHSRGSPQTMVDQTPRYDNRRKKKGRREHQVIGKAGIIRPDKRQKAKYL